MNKEARALQKRNTKSLKNRKKLYANIKRDSIASASGRSLALSVVSQTAHAAMLSQHHHKTAKDDDVASKVSDDSITVSDHALGLRTLLNTRCHYLRGNCYQIKHFCWAKR